MDLSQEQAREVLQNLQKNPVGFATDLLGINLWKGEEEILEALAQYDKVTVKSGHALGKDYTAAVALLWFLNSFPPAIVITTGPCNDDQTEILTEKGWKFFKDLNPEDKVAQRKGKYEIEFIKPLDIITFDYKGELIGFQNQLIDFLVTPNHRCLFNNELKEAQEIYGNTNGKFLKVASWRGEEYGDINWMEFLGFWFAEGYVRYDPFKHKYRITVTQKKRIDYIEALLQRVKGHFKNPLKKEKKSNGGYNYTFYDKEQAKIFISFKRRIPDWIKNSDTKSIKAFIRGYTEGDGSIDLNGSLKLCTYSSLLADDLHELCIKAGYISNKKTYSRDEEKVDHINGIPVRGAKTGGKTIYYEIKFWKKRGQYPTSQIHESSQLYWYKKYYEGKVYSVKVPSGVVMIRRNGKNSWTGNTERQVDEIVWGEIRSLFLNSKVALPGKLLESQLTVDDKYYAIGFTTKESKDVVGKFQGFHQKNILVIISEAQAVEDSIYEQIDSILTSENSKLLLIGNPLQSAGKFFESFKDPRYKKITLSCLEGPNYIEGREVIPGLVSRKWIDERREEWGEKSSLWQARVLGEFPSEGVDTLISLKVVEEAKNKDLEGYSDDPVILACDLARYGESKTVLISRKGDEFFKLRVREKQSLMESCGLIKITYTQEESDFLAVDDSGLGGGVVDRLAEQKVPVLPFNGGAKEIAVDQTHFKNLRSEFYWYVKKKFEAGEYSIKVGDEYISERDYEILKSQLCSIKFKLESDGRIKVESKDDMLARGVKSPDYADAFMISEYAKFFSRTANVGPFKWR